LAASVTDVPNGSCCGFPDINTVYRTSQENTGFAWQLGAGFNYPVSANIDLGIGYRYFRGPSFDPLFIGKNETPVPIDNDNHSVQVNLTIGIN
jgi:opacity protein-like surface antigen